MSGYNMSAGRTPEQIEKMKKLQASGVCAFCPEHFKAFHDNPVEFETDYWIVAKNDYPYENTSLHLLLVAKEHVQKINELSLVARSDLPEVMARIEKDFNLFSFSFGMRVGDIRYNAGSVDHLHAHVIVGDFSDPKNHQKIRFKMSSVPDKEQES